MNHIGPPENTPDYGDGKVIDLQGLVSATRRQIKPLLFCAFVGAVLGLLYLITTPKEYTAYSTVLADDGANRIVAEISAFEESLQNEAVLLNQIEVIRSRKVAMAVARSLDLHLDEAFLNPKQSLAAQLIAGTKSTIKSFLPDNSAPVSPQAADPVEAAISAAGGVLQKNVEVKRIGRSSAFLISYTTQDPALSALIANAYADAYMADQLNASFDATERTTVWMQSRLAELETNSRVAAEAVERFRSENGLTATDGRLLSEQQLAQLHTELSSAIADTARATALAEQYREVVDAGVGQGLAARILSLETPVDSRLAGYQERLAALVSRLSQIAAESGVESDAANRARQGLNDQASAAFNEVIRMAEQYSGEEASAKAREASLRTSVQSATQVNNTASGLQIELRALEQRAQAVASLYQSFLTRFETIEQQKSFPVSNIRVLSKAQAPRSASGPGTVKTLLLSLILGVFVGAVVGTIREVRDHFFRTGFDVSKETGLRFLGYLPHIKSLGSFTILNKLLKPQKADKGVYSATHPKSLYSETLRAVRIALDASMPSEKRPCLGVASALPREGKTTLSLNLGALIAASGRKVLLIDADIRKPGLTELTGFKKKPGLIEALTGSADWQDACVELGDKRLHVLPCIASSSIAHTSDLLASGAMGDLLAKARDAYDYVIVDLPPLGPVVDARAILGHLDRMVLLAEWGKTPKGLMQELLSDDPALFDKAIGIVLNQVDVAALANYGAGTGAQRFKNISAEYYSA